MKPWHANQKTTPRQEMQPELPLPNSSETHGAETEEIMRSLIGQMLTQTSYFVSFVTCQQEAVQYNLVSPVTGEALSFGLWAMATHIMSTCAQRRELILILQPLPLITQNRPEWLKAIDAIEALIVEICMDVFGEIPE